VISTARLSLGLIWISRFAISAPSAVIRSEYAPGFNPPMRKMPSPSVREAAATLPFCVRLTAAFGTGNCSPCGVTYTTRPNKADGTAETCGALRTGFASWAKSVQAISKSALAIFRDKRKRF
jgi:hypothetical protein